MSSSPIIIMIARAIQPTHPVRSGPRSAARPQPAPLLVVVGPRGHTAPGAPHKVLVRPGPSGRSFLCPPGGNRPPGPAWLGLFQYRAPPRTGQGAEGPRAADADPGRVTVERPGGRGWGGLGGRDRRRSGYLALFRCALYQLSYPTVGRPVFPLGAANPTRTGPDLTRDLRLDRAACTPDSTTGPRLPTRRWPRGPTTGGPLTIGHQGLAAHGRPGLPPMACVRAGWPPR